MQDLFYRIPESSVSCFKTEENTKNNEEEKEEFENKISKILKSYDLLKKNKIYKEVFKVDKSNINKGILINVFKIFETEDLQSRKFIELQMSLRE